MCVCDPGYAFNNEGVCLNINECAIGTDSCDPISEVHLKTLLSCNLLKTL